MAEAAIIAEKEGAQIIDINMGCPVPKVVKNGEGSALLEKPQLACQIVKAMKQAVAVPITVKIRSGFRPENIVAVKFSVALAKAGVSAIGIHGRTRDQYYSGQADWQIIKRIKENIDIPVIGSGDIWTPEDVERMLETTRCDAVMLGRGVLGNPWLISNTRDYLEGTVYRKPTAEDKVKGALLHLDLIIQLKGEEIGVKEMRKHIAWYLKGLPRTAVVKEGVFKAKTRAEVFNLLDQYLLTKKDNQGLV
jgi:nifR3 family TIM-barrel protein